MKKICILLLLLSMILSLISCKAETVLLHCDGEKCNNMVEVKVEKDKIPDESWVVFCQDCANTDLDD